VAGGVKLNETTHWNRPLTEEIDLLHVSGERKEVIDRMEAGKPSGL
jgi:hypothetical protein